MKSAVSRLFPLKGQIVFKAWLVLLCLVASVALGCSKSSKGDGSGDGTGMSDEDLALGQEQRFGSGNIPQAQAGGLLADIYFDFDSSELSSEAQETIRKNASILQGNTDLHAEVEGHCDRRGTREYNMALGEQRAKSVARFLANLGVNPSQLSTISYGSEIPLDPSNSEEAFAKNRRAHFAVYSMSEKNQTR